MPTELLIAAIGAIIVSIITAIGAVVVNVIVAKRVDRVGERVDRVGERVEQNISETVVVKGHVNSTASKMAEEIIGLRKAMELMKEAAAEKKETAALLAQAAAAKPANAPPVAEESLAKIQENTAETVEALKDAKGVAITPKSK